MNKVSFLFFILFTSAFFLVWIREKRLFSWQKFTCNSSATVRFVGKLSNHISESSGLAFLHGKPICLNDSNDSLIYLLNENYEIETTVGVPQTKNYDWEELQVDEEDIIWVGEIGINNFPQKPLVLHGLNIENQQITSLTIPLQVVGREKVLDFEAFFWQGNQLFLIKKFADHNLHHLFVFERRKNMLKLVHQTTIWAEGHVAGAAFDSQSNALALATYGRIYLYQVTNKKYLLKNCIPIRHGMQMEAIAWKKPGQLVFLNEEGYIFELEI